MEHLILTEFMELNRKPTEKGKIVINQAISDEFINRIENIRPLEPLLSTPKAEAPKNVPIKKPQKPIQNPKPKPQAKPNRPVLNPSAIQKLNNYNRK